MSGTNLALLVKRESLGIEFLDNLFGRSVLLDFTIEVEADHIARIKLASKLEEIDEALFLCLLHAFRRHGNYEVNVDVVMVLFVVLGSFGHLTADTKNQIPVLP